MMRLVWVALLACWFSAGAAGEMDDLVRQILESQVRERQADEERKSRFLADKTQQQKLLGETKAALAKAEAESKSLREQFAANQTRIKELDAELRTKSGDLGTLVGTIREYAGKLMTDVDASLISAQFSNRTEALGRLANGKEIPSMPQLENLWATYLQEMNEAGKFVRYPGKVTDAVGVEQNVDVYRVGAFTALAGDKYLRYVSTSGKLEEMPRQPAGDHRSPADQLKDGKDNLVKVAVDPSRGTVLERVALEPEGFSWLPQSLRGLMATGVDVAVIGLLMVASIWALGVAFERWFYYRRIELGRYPTKSALETDLTRHLTVIGTVAANAPYIGLLGTVMGIMMTFQRMSTEKGMDVHTIMVGLSVALKATAMGLLVAIPCVVCNNVLRRRIRELVTAYEVRHGS